MFSSLPTCSAEEELRRLFYVALTRAEKHLNISYVKLRLMARKWSPQCSLQRYYKLIHYPLKKLIVPEED